MSITAEQCRERLDEMADARIASLTTQARRDAAMHLIETEGAADTDSIEARLAEVFTAPTRESLRDQMARKAQAAVEYAERTAEQARADVDRAETARDRLAGQAKAAQDAIDEARADAETADAEVADARALADYAARTGDPGVAAGQDTDAHAETAQIAAESREG